MQPHLSAKAFAVSAWSVVVLVLLHGVLGQLLPPPHHLLTNVFLCSASLAAALFACQAARSQAGGAGRLVLAWWLIAISQCDIFLGDLASVALNGAICDTILPTKAFLFYLASYGFLLAGLLLLPANPLRTSERTAIWTGLGMTLIGAGLFFWNFLVAPAMHDEAEGVSLRSFIILSYASASLVMLWALTRLFLRRLNLQRKGVVLLLGVATAFLMLADFLFMQQLLLETAESSLPVELGWQASRLLFALAAALQLVPATEEEASPQAPRVLQHVPAGFGAVALPYAWLGAACFLLYWSEAHPLPMPGGALLAGIAGIVLLAILRHVAVFRDNQRLNDELRAELVGRQQAEEALRQSRDELELRVQQRTAELAAVNHSLQEEMAARQAATRSLEENHQLLQSLLDASQDAAFLMDPAGTCLTTNRTTAERLGVPPETLPGRNIFELLPPAVAEQRRHNLEKVVQSAKPGRFLDYAYDRWSDNTANPVLAPDGTVTAVALFARDVTAEKEAEENLRHRLMIEALVADLSHRFVKATPETVDSAINVSLETIGRFLGADRGYLNLHRAQEGLIDRAYEWTAPDIVPQRDQLQGFSVAGLTWSQTKLQQEEAIIIPDVAVMPPDAAAEQVFYRKYGVKSVLGVPLFAGNRLAAYLGFNAEREPRAWNVDDVRLLKLMGERVMDALERKHAEAALRESEARFRTLVETVPHGVVELDPQGIIRFCNSAYERIYGWAREECAGHHLADFMVDAEERERLQTMFTQLVASEEPIPCIVAENLTKDGGRIWVRIDCNYKHSAQGPATGLIAIITDVSEQHRMEERLRQTQKQESLSVMAGAIAHNFNNLLMAIQGNAEVGLGVTTEPAEVKRHFETIIASAGRAGELSHQMLTYAGSSFAEQRLIDLTALVKDSTEMMRSAVSVNCVLQCQLTEPLPRVGGNDSQLRQALINLLTNASEALGHQPGTVSVETGVCELTDAELAGFAVPESPVGGRYVFLRVSDTGKGIPLQHVKRIFDPFFSTKFTGRGLGLAVVRGTVCSHQGNIDVKTGDTGTAVTLYFPAREPVPAPVVTVAPRPVPAAPAAPQAPAARPAGRTILVADDEEDIRLLVTQVLTRQGHRILAAEDGQAAVDLFAQHAAEIDLAIIDLTMPRLTGTEVVEAIRRLKPGLPIILASGYSEEHVRQNFPDISLTAILVKPFNIKRLLDKVAACVTVQG